MEIKSMIFGMLNLTEHDIAVLDVVRNQKVAKSTAGIARLAYLPRTTTDYILKKLQRYRLIRRILSRKRYKWMRRKVRANTKYI